MVLCRADGDVLYANLAAAKMAGRPREDLVGNRLGELLHDAQATREVLQQLAIGAPWRKRFRSPSPDGQVRASEVRLSPVEGPRGVDTFVLTALDTSREDALERQLEHSQRLEALGTLAGGIAHDFNNVLNGVLGFTEVAAGMLEASHPAREVLDSSLKGIARARSLVEQILTFSRRVSPTLDAVRLAEVAEDGTSFLRASLPPHVDLTLHVDPSAGAVLADPHQLQQVLTNLCTNAYQAKGTTRIVVRVDEVRRARRGESAPLGRLVVEDDGEGMPPEVRDRIFEPFFTTKGSAGSGMGLAVCHGIIEGHRGFIEVDSAIGRGTRVEIYLPAAPDVDEQSEPARRPAPPPICPSGRVLLVDDEPQVLEVARLHLTGAGLEVEAHEDPIEALAAFASAPESFHVVATDLSMPKLAGDELARRIREFRPELNILLLSGVTASLDEETVEAFSAILPKPFTREALIETVARLIE
jgi:PAS domain S-box-containing protein